MSAANSTRRTPGRRNFHHNLRHSTFHFVDYGFSIKRDLATFENLPNEILLCLIDLFKNDKGILKIIRLISKRLHLLATPRLFSNGYSLILQSDSGHTKWSGANFLHNSINPPLSDGIPKSLKLIVGEGVSDLVCKQENWVRGSETKHARRLSMLAKQMESITVWFEAPLTGLVPLGIARLLDRARDLDRISLGLFFPMDVPGFVQLFKKCWWESLRALEIESVYPPDNGVTDMIIHHNSSLEIIRVKYIPTDQMRQGFYRWDETQVSPFMQALGRRDGKGQRIFFDCLEFLVLEGFQRCFFWQSEAPATQLEKLLPAGQVTTLSLGETGVKDIMFWEAA